MKIKRPWTRAEKSLLLTPLLIALASGAVWSQLCWSPDNRFLAVRENQPGDDDVRVFDAQTGALKWSRAGYSSNPKLEWVPDSRHMALSSDKGIQIFDVR